MNGIPGTANPRRTLRIPLALRWPLSVLLLSTFLAAPAAYADRIGELSSDNLTDQAARFLTLQDPTVRYALAGSILLGISCGLLGSFIVVRKMALVGDTLSHAVLPGVAIGFLWDMTKSPVAIFVGATFAGLLGTVMVGAVKQTTRLKEDTALGLVLATFFGVGVCLLTMIQRLVTGNKSGIQNFLFGQAAAISSEDLWLMAFVTILSIGAVALFYKEFVVTSFDPDFARSSGLPIQLIHYGLMLLVAFAVVVALQAVGVVLVSAMLITPAASAFLLTDRIHWMLCLAAGFGMLAGMLGTFVSFLGPGLPTGPFIVLSATTVFALSFLFGPRHGVVIRWMKQSSRSRRTQRENTLKAIYHVMESQRFQSDHVSIADLAARRREGMDETTWHAKALVRHGLATWGAEREQILFTPAGWELACSIVRNHRLWELYLTNAAHIAPDHVHDDAEKIEHVLGEEVVRDIERRLEFATHDPHGKAIPSLADVQRGATPGRRPESAIGYGGRS